MPVPQPDSMFVVESGDVGESVLGFVWILNFSRWNLNFTGRTGGSSVKMGDVSVSSSDWGYHVESLEHVAPLSLLLSLPIFFLKAPR